MRIYGVELKLSGVMGCEDAPVFLFWIVLLVFVGMKFIIGLLMLSVLLKLGECCVLKIFALLIKDF